MAVDDQSDECFIDTRGKEALRKLAWDALPNKRLIVSGHHTKAEWEQKKQEYDGKCAYCGQVRKLTKDHVNPIVSGGSDNIDNIVPACMGCNLRKHAINDPDKLKNMFPDMVCDIHY